MNFKCNNCNLKKYIFIENLKRSTIVVASCIVTKHFNGNEGLSPTYLKCT